MRPERGTNLHNLMKMSQYEAQLRSHPRGCEACTARGAPCSRPIQEREGVGDPCRR